MTSPSLIPVIPVIAVIAACATITFIAPAHGQSVQVPAPPQSRPIAIVNASVHPVSGHSIERGIVRFEDGVIVEVGPYDGRALPEDVETIDATGMAVYPGLISGHTTIGLVETLAVQVTDDRNEFGSMRPEARAIVAINPDTDLIPVARSAGILSAMVFPQGGVIAGRPAAIRMDGWTWESLAIESELGVFLNWPLTETVAASWMDRSANEQRRRIREQLDEIERFFDEAEASIALADADPNQPRDLRFESMRGTLAGERPLFISANSAGQIESAVAFALRRKLRPVIVGGAEAGKVSALLAMHEIPVVLRGVNRLPFRRHDPHDEPFTLPARLLDAGVRFCIASSDEPAHERNLPHHAATAVAHGLPREAAIRAITLSVAEIFGIADRVGSLEPGKAATLIVTDGPDLSGAGAGDPLELTTSVRIAFIDGRRIDLQNRQTRLRDKYEERYRQQGRLD